MTEGMPKFADLAADPPAKKRIGRPPGKKTGELADAPKKKTKRKYKKRPAKVAVSKREFSCFLDEDNGLQLCAMDGGGDPIQLTSADALAIAAFVERHRAALT